MRTGTEAPRSAGLTNGFDNITLGPSPALRLMAQKRAVPGPIRFGAAWVDVGRVLLRAAEAVIPLAVRDRS